MRVGLVVDASMRVPGGVQEYVRGLHDYLASAGHASTIITASEAINPIDRQRRVLFVGRRINVRRVTGISASASLTWASGGTIRNLLERERFDLLHFMAPTGMLANQIIARSTSTNVLTLLIAKDHGGLWLWFAALFRALWGTRLYPRLHGRIALSAPAQRYGARWFPGPCTIIPAGIDLTRFQPQTDDGCTKKNGKLTILYVGRLDPRKGITHLLEAYGAVRSQQNDLRLVLVGDGPEAEASRQFVEENGVPDVDFAGEVSALELPTYYRSADIFCAPAYENESFGVVLLEAMAAGLPIVGYANEGYRTVLTHEAQEALAPPGDVDALGYTLGRVARNGDLRARLAAWSRREVQHFSWQSIGQRIVNFYQQAMAVHQQQAG